MSRLEKKLGRKLTADEIQTARRNQQSIAKEMEVTPGEKEFKGLEREGLGKIKRKFRKDGHYKWKFEFTPNEGGKITKAAQAVQELMTPAWRIGTERNSSGVEVRQTKGNVFSVGIEFCKVCGFTPDYCEGHDGSR